MKKFGLILLGVIALGSIIALLVFGYTYSEGTRAGVLMKFARKGFIFKTYEGELNIGGIGNIPNTAQGNIIWTFSVKDQSVVDKLKTLEGRKVSLQYEEIVRAMPWQGETNHFVIGAEQIE